jgi:hypothetical protein
MRCLVFEVKSIQSFIFASGRLRDAIGGSELIDLLTNEQSDNNLLDAVLQSSETKHLIEFSRRAGGAFYAFSQDAAALDRFAALWTLAVQYWAPGLGFVIGCGTGANMPDAFAQAQADSRSQSSRERAQHPIAAPVAERAQRTGRVAVDRDKKDVVIDAATQRNKGFANPSRSGFITRYSPEEVQLNWRDWPRNLEQDADDGDSFPFARGARDLALIHADGNGMGQVLIKIGDTVKHRPDDFLKIYQTFSKAVEASTQQAAKQATRDVLLPARQNGELLAARPILLGGDDVIVLVRADLALAYVQAFARAFEKESREQLKKLDVADLPDQLTLGCGIAFIGANQPFAMAAALSESLMAHAKSQAKRRSQGQAITPSSLAFYRVTTALIDDYDTLVERVLTHHDGEKRYVHTLGTYALGSQACGSLPKLTDLQALVAGLQAEDMARGPVRGLLNLLQLDPVQARTRWRRWRQLMQEQRRAALEAFDDCMCKLMPAYRPDADDLPYAWDEDSDAFVSPLGDALDLLALQSTALSAIQPQEGITA